MSLVAGVHIHLEWRDALQLRAPASDCDVTVTWPVENGAGDVARMLWQGAVCDSVGGRWRGLGGLLVNYCWVFERSLRWGKRLHVESFAAAPTRPFTHKRRSEKSAYA